MTDYLLWLLPLCLLLRLSPVIVRPHAKATDTLFHLYLARRIREEGRAPLVIEKIVPDFINAYPYLFHRLLACFPLRMHGMVERLLPALFDTALLGCVLWLATMLSQGLPHGENIPLYAGIFFTFQPALLRYDAGPRLHYGSPRVMGQLLYALHGISLYHAWHSHSWTSLCVGVLTGAAIFSTSAFAIQTIVFFGLFLGLIVTPWYLAVLFLSFIVSGFLTKGRSWRDSRHNIHYSILYATQLQQRFVQRYHSPHRAYLQKLRQCLRNAARDPKSLFMHIYWVQRNPLNSLVFLYPECLLLVGGIATGMAATWQPLYALPLAGCACMFLMETKPMMFLGEGERYMQYAAPVLCVLTAQVAVQLPSAVMVVYALYGLGFWAAGMAAFWLLTKETAFDEKALKEFFTYANALPPGKTMHLGSFHWHNLYYGTHPFYMPLSPALRGNDTRWQPLYDNYPLPNGDLERVLHLFPTEYIITDTVHLERYKKLMPDPAYFERRCRLLHEVNGMCLYQVLSTLQKPSS